MFSLKKVSMTLLAAGTTLFLTIAMANTPPPKKIFFIGTGGTIAGIAENPLSPTYDPGKVTIEAILKTVPDIQSLAQISGQQLIDQLKLEALIASGLTEEQALKKPEAYVNTCSCNISEYHWRLMKDRIEKALNVDGYDAVIVTHGTDTIEETAFFLEMTVHSKKPVILVGASRPSNNPEADGPDNIRQAVRVAIDEEATGKGVMIVMKNRIYPAFDVTEVQASLATEALVDRFESPNFGTLGTVGKNKIFWNTKNKLNTANIRHLKFDTQVKQNFQKVPLLWQYVGNDSAELFQMYQTQKVKGYILAGFGNGSSENALRAMIKEATSPTSDVVVVDVSRTKHAVTDNFASYNPKGFMAGVVVAGTLNPYQAKIFLQLTLDGIESNKEEFRPLLSGLPATATLRDKVTAVFTEFLYKQMGLPVKTQ